MEELEPKLYCQICYGVAHDFVVYDKTIICSNCAKWTIPEKDNNLPTWQRLIIYLVMFVLCFLVVAMCYLASLHPYY